MNEPTQATVENWLVQLVNRDVWKKTEQWLRQNLPSHLQGKMSASDLITSAFGEALEHIHDLRGEESTERDAWFKTIAQRKLYEVQRKYTTDKRDISLEHDDEVHDLPAGSVEIIRDIRIDIQDLLKRVSSESLRIIQLFYLQGFTRGEVATSLGMKPGAVGHRVRLAIRELRDAANLKNQSQ